MAWLPDGVKFLKICLFVLTEFTNVTDRHTDRQTLHDDIGRACIASRGKNCKHAIDDAVCMFLLEHQINMHYKLHCWLAA